MFIFIPGSSFDLEIHIHFSMSDISYHLPWYWSDLFLPDHRSVIFRKVSRRFWNLLLICAFSDAFLRNLKAPKTTLTSSSQKLPSLPSVRIFLHPFQFMIWQVSQYEWASWYTFSSSLWFPLITLASQCHLRKKVFLSGTAMPCHIHTEDLSRSVLL